MFTVFLGNFPAQKFQKQNCDGTKNPLLQCLPLHSIYFSFHCRNATASTDLKTFFIQSLQIYRHKQIIERKKEKNCKGDDFKCFPTLCKTMFRQ